MPLQLPPNIKEENPSETLIRKLPLTRLPRASDRNLLKNNALKLSGSHKNKKMYSPKYADLKTLYQLFGLSSLE